MTERSCDTCGFQGTRLCHNPPEHGPHCGTWMDKNNLNSLQKALVSVPITAAQVNEFLDELDKMEFQSVTYINQPLHLDKDRS